MTEEELKEFSVARLKQICKDYMNVWVIFCSTTEYQELASLESLLAVFVVQKVARIKKRLRKQRSSPTLKHPELPTPRVIHPAFV
jgi:glutamate racemase